MDFLGADFARDLDTRFLMGRAAADPRAQAVIKIKNLDEPPRPEVKITTLTGPSLIGELMKVAPLVRLGHLTSDEARDRALFLYHLGWRLALIREAEEKA